MYIDFIKNDYIDMPECERKKYIDRDKKALAGIIQEKIAQNVMDIVERWYKLSDVGIILQKEKFLDLLKEAEQLFGFGLYTGSIAIVGIACEEYCKYLAAKQKIKDVKTQELRINELYKYKVITSEVKDALHRIRKLRNDCMHYNVSFKQLKEEELENHAFEMIANYKTCLKPLAVEVDRVSNEELITSLVKEGEIILNEYLYKHRNILNQTQNINLQIHPSIDAIICTSIYFIDEIDISESFHEMTLIDIKNKYPIVVDLTLPQCEMLKSLGLKTGNLITAYLISAISCIGETAEYLLLKIDDVSRIICDRKNIFENNYNFAGM